VRTSEAASPAFKFDLYLHAGSWSGSDCWVVERDRRPATQVIAAQSYYPCTVSNSILFLFLRGGVREGARRAMNDLPPEKLTAARLCGQPQRRKQYTENTERKGNRERERGTKEVNIP
jgi:hypothetical protein